MPETDFKCKYCQDGAKLEPGAICQECFRMGAMLCRAVDLLKPVEQKVVFVNFPFRDSKRLTYAEHRTARETAEKLVNDALAGGWSICNLYSETDEEGAVCSMVVLQRFLPEKKDIAEELGV